MNHKNKTLSFLLMILTSATLYQSCKQLGLDNSKSDNTTAIAAVLLATRSSSSTSACSGGTSTGSTITLSSATIDSSSGCLSGVTTSMDSALPDWIKNNFKCSVGFVSGSNYCFKSKNLPNTTSSYYPSTNTTLYEARVTTGTNPNSTSSQNMVYTIPSSPSKGSGTVSTQGGLVSIGITTNGLAIFNNAAAPPDVLATEADTFDNYQGHPQNSGIYHHHAAAPKLCGDAATTSGTKSTVNANSCNNATLIGIALDGYAIYGQKCDNATSSTADDFTPSDLDSLHGHTAKTTHFSTATYHYHYKYDSTATIYTLMGSYFYGNIGSASN